MGAGWSDCKGSPAILPPPKGSGNGRHALHFAEWNPSPGFGLGTYPMTGITAQKAITAAIGVGYRHIDTAQMYGNEADVGAAIKASGIDRNQILSRPKSITATTLPPISNARSRKACANWRATMSIYC